MNKIKFFPVDVEIDEDGVYVVSCPEFKAYHADGTTIDTVLDSLKEVVQMCLEESMLYLLE